MHPSRNKMLALGGQHAQAARLGSWHRFVGAEELTNVGQVEAVAAALEETVGRRRVG